MKKTLSLAVIVMEACCHGDYSWHKEFKERGSKEEWIGERERTETKSRGERGRKEQGSRKIRCRRKMEEGGGERKRAGSFLEGGRVCFETDHVAGAV